ncbi:MAG: endolytic transglycosylase MltG [Chthonomonadales bacterium]
MKGLRRRVRAAAGVLGAAALCAGIWVAHELRPASPAGRRVIVNIVAGTKLERVAAVLRRRHLIRSATVFLWAARLKGVPDEPRPGRYAFSTAMSALHIADRLRRGDTGINEIRVTIPEGYGVRQIAAALVRHGILSEGTGFLDVARHPGGRVQAPFPIPKAGLEGFLFPDTYWFPRGVRPERAAQEMVDTFVRRFYLPNRADIAASGRTLAEIVTVASLVEREAKKDEDRPKIAGVIYNRLARGMPLQVDATVLYALGHHKSRVLYSDLKVASPYNTYRRRGLPPGPIANPGLPSLEAALHPERSDYLYYVAGPDGAHIFSRTEAEHLQCVGRMRALRARSAAGGSG